MIKLLQIAGLTLIGSMLSITLRKTNAELSMLIAIGIIVIVLGTGFDMMQTVYRSFLSISSQFAIPQDVFEPIIKCTAISAVTKITSTLCNQSGEQAIAATIELIGSISGVLVSMPLLQKAFELLSEMMVMPI